ncbi:MAG: cytochrome c [Desulfovibrionaceae bacterium]|jgi:cytochrome c556|nr:cytochrome c [Desulfovibrionaceae bacterium]
MKKLLPLALAACAATLALPAAAQFAKPEDAIKYRQAAFVVMAKHFGSLRAMAEGKAPFDVKVAAADADVIAAVSHLPYTGFIPGTEKGGNTEAKPEIWQQQAKFKEAADKTAGELDKVIAAARSGSLDSLKTAVGSAGRTCKACHDDFRKKD